MVVLDVGEEMTSEYGRSWCAKDSIRIWAFLTQSWIVTGQTVTDVLIVESGAAEVVVAEVVVDEVLAE